MLVQFSVENFMSINEKVVFSMLASSDKELSENLIEGKNEKYLKSAVIYGANASGKTNIFRAINAVILMIRNSNNMQPGMKLPINPFKFDEKNITKPSSFEFIMVIDNIKYVYGFSADQDKIYEEYLYYYPNGRETKIFDRTNTNDYSFPQKDEKLLNDIAAKNAPNKFFIATATNWNYEKTKSPYKFLSADINTFNNLGGLRDLALSEYLKNNKELKDFALEFLKKADFNIEDYKVLETDVPDDVLAAIPDFIKAGMNMKEKPKVFTAFFKHSSMICCKCSFPIIICH